MQSTYAMLMLHYRSRALTQQADGVNHQPLEADELADELYWGLNCVVSAVNDYSMAFEALGGMKGQSVSPRRILAFTNTRSRGLE